MAAIVKALKWTKDRFESSGPTGRSPASRQKTQVPQNEILTRLLSRVEVAEATSADVAPPTETITDDYAGLEFRADDGVWVQINVYNSPDAEAAWRGILSDVPKGTELEDLGDAAFVSGGHVFVRTDARVFFLAGGDPGGRDLSGALETLARSVAERI